MRALLLAALALGSGCSLIFDGKDLRGTNGQGDGGADLAVDLDGSTDMPLGNLAGFDGGGDGGSTCMMGDGGLFLEAKEVLVGGQVPISVGIADFNQDGKLDIVTANESSNNVSLLIGAGSGTFTLAPNSPFASCSVPTSLVVADFDQNGKPDVIVGCYDDVPAIPVTAISLHMGGVGTFTAATPIVTTGINPVEMKSGDFNGDTKPDVAILFENSKTLVILPGNGLGGFGSPTTIAVGAIDPDGLGVGNWNGDNRTDIAVTDYSNGTVNVYLSSAVAPSGFVAQTQITGLGFIGSPASFDVNGDMLEDLVIAQGYTTSYVSVFRNQGAGAFPATPTNDFIADDSGSFMGIGDFNCDGKLDVALTGYSNTGAGRVFVMNNEGGTFKEKAKVALDYNNYLAVGDLNGDGLTDIVTTQRATNGSVNVILTHY